MAPRPPVRIPAATDESGIEKCGGEPVRVRDAALRSLRPGSLRAGIPWASSTPPSSTVALRTNPTCSRRVAARKPLAGRSAAHGPLPTTQRRAGSLPERHYKVYDGLIVMNQVRLLGFLAMSDCTERIPMGGRSIVVDDEVFTELQSLAEPLVDDANSVLRRILNLSSSGSRTSDADLGTVADKEPAKSARARLRRRAPKPSNRAKTKSARAPKGSLLPEAEYELPLLEALLDLNGSARTSDVVDLLEKKLEGKLTEVDREKISSGEIRWRNRVQFVRLGLIKEGLMVKDSPRGVWEITDAGRERIAQAGTNS